MTSNPVKHDEEISTDPARFIQPAATGPDEMTPREFQACLAATRLSGRDIQALLGQTMHEVQAWAGSHDWTRSPPPSVSRWLRQLATAHLAADARNPPPRVARPSRSAKSVAAA